ncbi:MAG: dihydroorotate dehydrogenase, partial [bacterium]
MIDLAVDLAGLRLATPLIGASGVFGYGAEWGDVVDLRAFGAVVAKTVTARPRAGNPPPRIVDAGCGVVNSIGLENVGCDGFVAANLPGLKLPCRLFASVGGDSVDDYRAAAAALKGAPGIDALEVNVSCPNVATGGITFGSRPESAAAVIAAVAGETDLPVVAKLPPLIAGIEEVARAAREAGAAALTVANTYPA